MLSELVSNNAHVANAVGWLNVHVSKTDCDVNRLQPLQVRTSAEPDQFSIFGIQLQPSLCTLFLNVGNTAFQTTASRVHVCQPNNCQQLRVVCEIGVAYGKSVDGDAAILRICDELSRPWDKSLRDSASEFDRF